VGLQVKVRDEVLLAVVVIVRHKASLVSLDADATCLHVSGPHMCGKRS